jgi:transcriptional regulator with XRE-family HTH domain
MYETPLTPYERAIDPLDLRTSVSMARPHERYRNRLREWRERRDLTLEQLGAKADIPWRSLQKYETGRVRLPIHLMPRLADALSIRSADLLVDTEALSDEETQLLLAFRSLPASDQRKVLQIVRTFAEQA